MPWYRDSQCHSFFFDRCKETKEKYSAPSTGGHMPHTPPPASGLGNNGALGSTKLPKGRGGSLCELKAVLKSIDYSKDKRVTYFILLANCFLPASFKKKLTVESRNLQLCNKLMRHTKLWMEGEATKTPFSGNGMTEYEEGGLRINNYTLRNVSTLKVNQVYFLWLDIKRFQFSHLQFDSGIINIPEHMWRVTKLLLQIILNLIVHKAYVTSI